MLTKDKEIEIVDKYNKGSSISQLSKEYGIYWRGIKNILKNYGVETRTFYKINENYSIVYFGSSKHPECKSILEDNEEIYLIEKTDEINNLSISHNKIPFVITVFCFLKIIF